MQLLFRHGYRLEHTDKITDPLKRIELFKAVASPAYIVAALEQEEEEQEASTTTAATTSTSEPGKAPNASSRFSCPVKRCFAFACEASARARDTPEYKREYQEIEQR